MCSHQRIKNVNDPDLLIQMWECESCGERFVRYEDYSKACDAADLAPTVAAGLLWDFHQRAVEHYGAGSAPAAAVSPDADGGADDEHAHIYGGDGTCTVTVPDRNVPAGQGWKTCGYSPFLGS